ncbi:MAG: universal stress protein [Gemmatimonadales bacterium]
MFGDRILVASDDSDEGRYAVDVAMRLRSQHGAPLALLRVGDATDGGPQLGGEATGLAEWLEGQSRSVAAWVAQGVPGVEISRFADRHKATLIVLGRRDRRGQGSASLGETTDAVVRRTGIPVLAVPKGGWPFRRGLVALDETPRAHQVLDLAARWSREIDLPLTGVSVTRTASANPGVRGWESSRTGVVTPGGPPPVRIALRSGSPVAEILDQVSAIEADVLVIGYRRGGPPKVVEPTETARSLLLAAPCAVLTVPL